MPTEFTLKLEGLEKVLANLKELGEAEPNTMLGALFEEGTMLLNESQDLVPVDLGPLRASGTVQEDKAASAPTVLVGYGGAAVPYALSVHENPRSGKTGGVSPSGQKYQHWAKVGQWKYLETPFKARTKGFTSRIAGYLKRSLLKGG